MGWKTKLAYRTRHEIAWNHLFFSDTDGGNKKVEEIHELFCGIKKIISLLAVQWNLV